MSRSEATEASPSRTRPDLRAEGVKQRAKPSISCQRFPTLSSVQGVRPGTLREGGEQVGKECILDTSLQEADLTAFVIIWGGDLSYANLTEQRDLRGQDLGGCALWRRSSPVATSRGRTSGVRTWPMPTSRARG